MKISLVVLVVMVCLKGSHGMFGLSVNGQWATDFTAAVKTTSTAIGLTITAVQKVEMARNTLNIDVTANLKYDMITIRLYLISYKAFIDRLGTYASGTMPTPTTSAILTEVRADLANLKIFTETYKTSVMNIDTALKTMLVASITDDMMFSESIENIFTATTGLIGTPGLTAAMVNTAIVAADATATLNFIKTSATNFGLQTAIVNTLATQITALVAFQTALQASVTPVPMAVSGWASKLIGTASGAQKNFIDLIDKETKAQRTAITAIETKISTIVDIAETLIVPAVTDGLETFYNSYSAAFVALSAKIAKDLSIVLSLANANVAKVTADTLSTEVKTIVTAVAAKVFGDKAVGATICVPIYQADFANAIKLEYSDINTCMTDALQAVPFAFDEYNYLFQQLQATTNYYLNFAGWCAKYITATSTPTNNAAMSTCVSAKVMALKEKSTDIITLIGAMDTRLAADITVMLMTNLDACISAAQSAKSTDITYYHAVFDGCAGITIDGK